MEYKLYSLRNLYEKLENIILYYIILFSRIIINLRLYLITIVLFNEIKINNKILFDIPKYIFISKNFSFKIKLTFLIILEKNNNDYIKSKIYIINLMFSSIYL